jgi:hypothetical protein
MEIVAFYDFNTEREDDPEGHDAETIETYELCRCPSCSGITLQVIPLLGNDEDPQPETLYPAGIEDEIPPGLPEGVRREFLEALQVRGTSANAYAALLGRVLSVMCRDRGAGGRTLQEMLHSLAERESFPPRLTAVASGLRELRNVGAHPERGDLTAADVPVLDSLTRALLEYVYSAPLLVEEVENSLRLRRG